MSFSYHVYCYYVDILRSIRSSNTPTTMTELYTIILRTIQLYTSNDHQFTVSIYHTQQPGSDPGCRPFDGASSLYTVIAPTPALWIHKPFFNIIQAALLNESLFCRKLSQILLFREHGYGFNGSVFRSGVDCQDCVGVSPSCLSLLL